MVAKPPGVLGKKHQKVTTEKFSIYRLLLAYIFLSFASFSAYADKLFYFEIPPQSADKALVSFAKITKKTILFSYKLTQDHHVSGLTGYLQLEHGISRLLRGSGLQAKFNSRNEIRIVLADKSPIQSDNKANIEQVTLEEANDNSPSGVEQIAIVGTRDIARSIHELPVPVDIISNEMMTKTGQLDVGRMLQTLAPSFNFSSSSISDGTDVLKPATLRGLGPDQTLILVNGKRRHHASLIHINTSVGRGTAGADLNSIPFNSIKRIEILRDGAAAQYGSDAIAGVINIVLKDSETVGLIKASYGQFKEGDGESTELAVNKGFSINNKGFITTSINLIEHESTNRAGLHGTCQFSNCPTSDNGDYLALDPREASVNRSTFEIGDPAYQQYSFAYNANYPLALGDLYSFAILSRRENDSAAFFRHNNNLKANPKLQDNDAVIPQGYLPYIHSAITDSSFNIGLRNIFENDISLDISYTYGDNEIDYVTKNSVNPSYVEKLLAEGEMSAQQIRQQIPRSANAYGLTLSLQTFNIDIQQNFDYYTLAFGMELRKDKYQVGSGEEYSYFDYTTDLPLHSSPIDTLAGIQGFPGISPNKKVDESRDVASIYVELNSELSERINLSTALRYDDYDGFGDTSNLKVAGNWRLNDSIKLRGSISTGFRAPSMQQLYFNNISTQFLVDENNHLTAERVGTFRNDSLLARAIGVPELQEEQSTNISLGSVIDFSNNWSLTLDYYAINIDDRIVISNKLCPESSSALSHAILSANVDKAQVFLNGADTKTHGLDIITTWRAQALGGDLSLTFAANYTNTDVTALYTPADSALHSLSKNKVFAEQDISIIEEWQPQDRISLNSHYQKENWTLSVAINRYGEYTITDGGKQTYGAEALTDVRFEHFVASNTSWYVGINNLFDVMPDENEIGNSHAGTIVDQQGNTIVSSSGVFMYSRRSAPFGFNGSYYYLGVNYHF